MALPNIFRKTQPSSTPALDTLTDHLAHVNGNTAQRVKISTRIGGINVYAARKQELEEKLVALRAQIDVALSDAQYANAEPPDLKKERRQLDVWEQDYKSVVEIVRLNTPVIAKLQEDHRQLVLRFDELKLLTPRILWAATVERMAAEAGELETAVSLFKAAHRRAFVAARAADMLAERHHIGEFQNSGLYGQLNVTVPAHEAFHPNKLGPEAQQNQYRADLKAVDQEAESLLSEMLKGEGA